MRAQITPWEKAERMAWKSPRLPGMSSVINQRHLPSPFESSQPNTLSEAHKWLNKSRDGLYLKATSLVSSPVASESYSQWLIHTEKQSSLLAIAHEESNRFFQTASQLWGEESESRRMQAACPKRCRQQRQQVWSSATQ